MRKFIFIGIGAVAILGGAYLVMFQWPFLKGLFNTGRGYPAAQTPLEAVDGFKKAAKARDYNDAADIYLTGTYAEQMKKGATAANALGVAVDNLLWQMNNKGFDSDRVKSLLAFVEPFPQDFVTGDLKKISDTESTFVLEEDKSIRFKGDPNWYNMNVDTSFYRALCGPPGFKLVGKAKLIENKSDKAWKLDIPFPTETLKRVDRLNTRYKTYVLVLEKWKSEVRNTPMTKDEFETKLKQDLETAGKD